MAWAIEWMRVPATSWDEEGQAGVCGTDCRNLLRTCEVWNAYSLSNWKCLVGSYIYWPRTQEVRVGDTPLGTICIKMIFRARGLDETTKGECTDTEEVIGYDLSCIKL